FGWRYVLGEWSMFCGVGGVMWDVRLVNGSSPCAGRVEVYHDGQWGTVYGYSYYGYDLTWDMKAAAVVCKALGCGAALLAPGDAHFGRGSGSISTYGVQCKGSERALRDCPSGTWGHYSWSHSSDAGVIIVKSGCDLSRPWACANYSAKEGRNKGAQNGVNTGKVKHSWDLTGTSSKWR
uniref:SRCR domain-containing protein n=1 Tax=Callorhinchus milii TaxID=7868 RepID=A0A4W3GPT5_CALMI